MLKKIFKIIVILIILLAVGLGIYWYFNQQQLGQGDTTNSGGLNIRDFFPFGRSDTSPTTPTTNETPGDTTSQSQTPVVLPDLWQISSNPQSGAVIFTASGTPLVRFVDKATGNIFESSLNLIAQTRLTNATIPKVYEAIWQPKGEGVVLRFLGTNNETIRSLYGKLATSTISTDSSIEILHELQTTFLPENITSLSVNQSTGALAYVVKTQNGSLVFVTNASGASPRQVFESLIKDFEIRWVNNTTLGLFSKPSAEATGQVYIIKTDSSRVERILGGQAGLMATINSDGTRVAFSRSTGRSLSSGLFNPKTGDTLTTSLTLIPDKCAWAAKSTFLYCAVPRVLPTGNYPDAWYQGLVTFNDTIWRIDTSSGAAKFLIDPVEGAKTEIDAINLSLDQDGGYLIFTNKKDSQLWAYRITE